MEFTDQQIIDWVNRFLLPFFRVGAFLMVLPVFGTQMVSPRIRIGLAVMVTIVMLPLFPAPPVQLAADGRTMMFVAQEVLTGVALAFVVQLLFQLFVLAGQIIAMQMGLGFASMIDPSNGISVPIVGQFYLLLVTLLFLAMNGHLVVIEALAESFQVLPVAGQGLTTDVYEFMARGGTWLFASATLIALPAVCALLTVNFAFGIMTRAAPQLNVFTLGFPIMLGFGLLVIYFTLSGFVPQFERLARVAFENLSSLPRL